jgi:hypothetical protein
VSKAHKRTECDVTEQRRKKTCTTAIHLDRMRINTHNWIQYNCQSPIRKSSSVELDSAWIVDFCVHILRDGERARLGSELSKEQAVQVQAVTVWLKSGHCESHATSSSMNPQKKRLKCQVIGGSYPRDFQPCPPRLTRSRYHSQSPLDRPRLVRSSSQVFKPYKPVIVPTR